MYNSGVNPLTQRLIDAFSQFRKLKWNESKISGLTPSEIMVLFHLNEKEISTGIGTSVSEISKHLRVTTPTITQQLNSLENRNYLERSIDQVDRRIVRVKLTGKGKNTVETASSSLIESFNGLVEILGEDKSLELAELLSQVFSYFQNRDHLYQGKGWDVKK